MDRPHGDPCGSTGQFCRADGTCACFPGFCPDNAPLCVEGTCIACPTCPTGQCCTADGSCGACTVFLTYFDYTGNLGGLTGADAQCQQMAKVSGLPGEYKAWLSDGTGSPCTRFVQVSVPYRRVDGVKVADNWADLLDGGLAAPINVTNNGQTVNGGVWSATWPNGTLDDSSSTCGGWRVGDRSEIGNIGASPNTDGFWTRLTNRSCEDLASLYCFQQR
jgi:hypothetical protein